MVALKTSQEAAAAPLTGAELIGGVQSGANVKITMDQIKDFVVQIGTFEPTLGDGTNNYTLTTANGRYTRIGDRVFGEIDCIWSSIGSAGAGQLRISGLPFAPSANAACTFGRIYGLDTTAAENQITGLLTQTLTTIIFERVADNAGPTALPANSSSATGRIIASFSYPV